MQSNDFAWFKSHYDELFKKYGKCFLAIKDKKVLAKYKTYAEGVKETSKTEKPGTFIIQACTGDVSAYNTCIASMNF